MARSRVGGFLRVEGLTPPRRRWSGPWSLPWNMMRCVQGMLEKQTLTPRKPGHGLKGVVDVVLGAQWGDEGKGKLVSE